MQKTPLLEGRMGNSVGDGGIVFHNHCDSSKEVGEVYVLYCNGKYCVHTVWTPMRGMPPLEGGIDEGMGGHTCPVWLEP